MLPCKTISDGLTAQVIRRSGGCRAGIRMFGLVAAALCVAASLKAEDPSKYLKPAHGTSPGQPEQLGRSQETWKLQAADDEKTLLLCSGIDQSSHRLHYLLNTLQLYAESQNENLPKRAEVRPVDDQREVVHELLASSASNAERLCTALCAATSSWLLSACGALLRLGPWSLQALRGPWGYSDTSFRRIPNLAGEMQPPRPDEARAFDVVLYECLQWLAVNC